MSAFSMPVSGVIVMVRLRRFSSLIVLLLIGLLIGSVNPVFFDPMNLARIATTSSIPLLMALGGLFVIQMGSIDLSVEGVVAVSAVCLALLIGNTVNAHAIGFWALPIAILVGALTGLINGLLQVKMRIPSFMATLGVGFIGIGLATALLEGNTVRVLDMNIRARVGHWRRGGSGAAQWYQRQPYANYHFRLGWRLLRAGGDSRRGAVRARACIDCARPTVHGDHRDCRWRRLIGRWQWQSVGHIAGGTDCGGRQ
jgi:hypothetical protein